MLLCKISVTGGGLTAPFASHRYEAALNDLGRIETRQEPIMPQTLIRPPVRQADSVTNRYHEIICQVAALQRHCRNGVRCEKLLQSVADRLAGLPLSTEDYGRASCHVANTRRYLAVGERGAGGYELRMLAGVLASEPP